MDDFCDPFGPVADWSSQQLHAGRIYPRAASAGSDRAHLPIADWQTGGVTIERQEAFPGARIFDFSQGG